MLSFQELEIFVAAAEQGSFSEAGRLLHLSQPAVSQAIQNLEKRLEAQLFNRVGRMVRLSEAGQVLLPMARELLAGAARLQETMGSLHGEVVGKITIGCSTTSGKYLLPKLIARFRTQFPGVRADVLVHSRKTVLSQLLDGQIGFGITSKQIEYQDLEYLPFFRDEVILIAPPGHPWALSRHIQPADLLGAPLIMRERGSGTAEVLTQKLEALDILPEKLNVVMVLGNTEAIAMSVEEGIGLAFVSRLAAARGLESGRLVEIAVEGMTLSRDLSIARNRRFPFTRSQAAFWEFLRHALATQEFFYTL